MASIELGTHLRGNSAKYHECLEACVACLVACGIFNRLKNQSIKFYF